MFPILPLLTIRYGGDPLLSGILIAAFSLMQVIAMPILGRLSDRFGRKPILLFSLWGTVLSFSIMGFTHSIFWLLIARMIDGASGGNLSIAQAYIADVTKKENRASGMGIIAAGISLGFIIGPLWGGFFSNVSPTFPFFAAAAITIISAILTHVFLPESVSEKETSYEKKHFNFAAFLKDNANSSPILLFVVYLFLFWAQSAVFTTMSLFGEVVLKLSLVGVSILFAFGGVLSALIQGFAIGKAVKKVGEKRLFFVSVVITGIGLMLLGISGHVLVYFISMTVYSIGNSFLTPLVNAFVSEKSSVHEQGGVLGLLQSFGSVGRIFGPVFGGFLFEKVSPFAPAWMGLLIIVLIYIIGWKVFANKKP